MEQNARAIGDHGVVYARLPQRQFGPLGEAAPGHQGGLEGLPLGNGGQTCPKLAYGITMDPFVEENSVPGGFGGIPS